MYRLYSYFRSSAAYRVRIALELKGIPYEIVPVNLLQGEQKRETHKARHPAGLVPVLEVTTADGHTQRLTQSLAIIEYLDEIHPTPPLLPADPFARAQVRALAQLVACEIHPVNNLRVLNYLTGTLGVDEANKLAWYRHWIAEGLAALEAMVTAAENPGGPFAWGDSPTLADCCIVPQLFNARRFECDLTPYPRLTAIEAACQKLPAFQKAAPATQPDAR
ncbi:maleylacetoacetate isomerase [Hydrogenophilus thermoluteolus]|jgi:maleylacetoacetate isomerase|nr:maleylacetoacetate isomerase [Hydrogenophilus thermoluteolus]MBW7656415.1 maleylacetoacetate isomerase [Hydrogenophilus thermoluteolus]HCO77808.1 maleylacetoacetate isomerase [Rhodocyclaceae bacterium]HNQ49703.1 maleylacetoacetate isomerase [Hydrogenophilus thermoluteolus]HNU19252.1 maleylacetoacetate isomerase [Hydrogenophilus thermoluteolus]